MNSVLREDARAEDSSPMITNLAIIAAVAVAAAVILFFIRRRRGISIRQRG